MQRQQPAHVAAGLSDDQLRSRVAVERHRHTYGVPSTDSSGRKTYKCAVPGCGGQMHVERDDAANDAMAPTFRLTLLAHNHAAQTPSQSNRKRKQQLRTLLANWRMNGDLLGKRPSDGSGGDWPTPDPAQVPTAVLVQDGRVVDLQLPSPGLGSWTAHNCLHHVTGRDVVARVRNGNMAALALFKFEVRKPERQAKVRHTLNDMRQRLPSPLVKIKRHDKSDPHDIHMGGNVLIMTDPSSAAPGYKHQRLQRQGNPRYHDLLEAPLYTMAELVWDEVVERAPFLAAYRCALPAMGLSAHCLHQPEAAQ
ncbi:hypothetical protein GPECTOR_388g197 [Gonium pectorale]|uniref:Uncharacterized protein n=1 Tax=Gonium pectorale TaxID=33097 RepID=A0A150FX09_GONPE|nr:hypothetical protein GPECTOR_388g197 [Gonium pectorale]|eukprot:KXZ41570.1 hypothetical protein GPECTOR_388g197 [Gonium pectorale]